MGNTRVEFVPQFYMGDDAVLVALDRDEIDDLAVGFRTGTSVHLGEQAHVFIREDSAGSLEVRADQVTWRLSKELREEISAKLDVLKLSPKPGHHYVDIVHPATTLILSVNEYPNPLSGR